MTSSSGGKRITLRRPLQRLYLVEFATTQEREEQPDTIDDGEVVDSDARSAAEKARDQIKIHSMYEQGELDC